MDEKHPNTQMTDDFWEATLAREFAPHPSLAPDRSPSDGGPDTPSMDATEGAGDEPAFDMDAAFTAYNAHRQKVQRRAAFFFSLVVAIGATAFFAAQHQDRSDSRSDAASQLERKNPIAYAQSLFNRVYGAPTGESRALEINDLLQRDEEARAEYLRALESTNSYVRMVAREALADSGIPLDIDQLVATLSVRETTLAWPLELVDASASERHLWAALETQGAHARESALEALFLQGYASPPLKLDAGVILPHLRDSDRGVRSNALSVLSVLGSSYEPGPELEYVLCEDEDAGMRIQAARLLADKLGEAGRDAIFARTRVESDPRAQRNMWLSLYKSPRAPAFAREMLARRAHDESARVMYAIFLAQKGEPEHGLYLLPLVLGGTNADALYRLVDYAHMLGRDDLREQLLAASELVAEGKRNLIRSRVALWDLGSEDPARWRMGLTLAQEPGARITGLLRTAVAVIAEKGNASCSRDAAKLLEAWGPAPK